jgi:hypothetical protein
LNLKYHNNDNNDYVLEQIRKCKSIENLAEPLKNYKIILYKKLTDDSEVDEILGSALR